VSFKTKLNEARRFNRKLAADEQQLRRECADLTRANADLLVERTAVEVLLGAAVDEARR
jgi:hypothetical protein